MAALELKDAWLATGHYALKSWSTPLSAGATPRPQLLRPSDRHKDQTYYLAAISEKALARTLFPISHLAKPQVRELAKKWDLATAEKEESMGICFVGERRKFEDFLSLYIPPSPGPIIEVATGKIIARHPGLWRYTLGQNAKVQGMPQKMFVSHKDPAKNEIHVVPDPQHPSLFKKQIIARDWHWIWEDSPPPGVNEPEGFRAQLQFRHRMLDVPCTVRKGGIDEIIIDCDEAQHAVTPGQVAVLWDDRWCIGSGTITGAN